MTKPERMGSGGFNTSAGPHFGKLEQVFDDVWWAWGTTRFMPGTWFPRTMTVIRDGDGLVLIHAVMLPEEEQAKLDALGPVRHIVRLGAFHGMDDPLYVKRYAPSVWAPPEVDHQPGVSGAKELRPGGPLPLSDATLLEFEGSKAPESALVLERHGGILLACDAVQNWETTAGCSALGTAMAKVMGFRGRACIGPGWRKACEPKDGRGFGPSFRKLLELPFSHAIGGHGGPMRDTAKRDLTSNVQRIYGQA